MKNHTLARKCCIAAATLTLCFGTTVTIVHAEDAKDGTKMNDKKEMQDKMQEQQKAMEGLQANFDDATFVTVASMANNDEIKAAKAADKMSSNQDVKDFANKMIEDHTKIQDQLKSMGEKNGWHVSEECDVKHKMAMHDMKDMSGADFDKAYASAQVKDHEDAVALYTLASEKATNDDLKQFAKDTLPTLKDHLKMARSLEKKMMAAGT